MTTEEQKFWFERILFSSVLFIKLLLIFRMSKEEWPYALIFCITAIAGWFALISPAYRDPDIQRTLTQVGYYMSIITSITTGVYIVREKPNTEGWIRPTVRNFLFFMFCALAILFILFRIIPFTKVRADAQYDTLNRKADKSAEATKAVILQNQVQNYKMDQALALTLLLNKNLTEVKKVMSKANTMIGKIEKRQVVTTREVKKSAATVNEIQNTQVELKKEVKKDLEAVAAKTDTLKAVVASVVILPDTTRSDSAKAAVRTVRDSVVVRESWWNRIFRKKKK